jgi:hypothetical protein
MKETIKALVRRHVTVEHLDVNNRMARIGGGKNKGRGFFRVDLWWVGVRFHANRTKIINPKA